MTTAYAFFRDRRSDTRNGKQTARNLSAFIAAISHTKRRIIYFLTIQGLLFDNNICV
jgi:hypothetical protein